jgi:hypothetical protein
MMAMMVARRTERGGHAGEDGWGRGGESMDRGSGGRRRLVEDLDRYSILIRCLNDHGGPPGERFPRAAPPTGQEKVDEGSASRASCSSRSCLCPLRIRGGRPDHRFHPGVGPFLRGRPAGGGAQHPVGGNGAGRVLGGGRLLPDPGCARGTPDPAGERAGGGHHPPGHLGGRGGIGDPDHRPSGPGGECPGRDHRGGLPLAVPHGGDSGAAPGDPPLGGDGGRRPPADAGGGQHAHGAGECDRGPSHRDVRGLPPLQHPGLPGLRAAGGRRAG